MKKLLVVMLVLAMVFGMSGVAFAYEDWSPVTINKALTAQGVNPEEEFSFTVGEGSGERDGVEVDAPQFDPDVFSITLDQGETVGFAEIELPEFNQVGVYTYEVEEVAGDTAGFIYNEETYFLVVTVINDPDSEGFLRVLTITDGNNLKQDAFQNEFYAGDLTVNKEITGNYSDPNDEFEITITVSADEGKVINDGPIEWNTENVNEDDGVYTAIYNLKGGESVTIQNLPYDVAYEVEETDSGEYEVSYDENVAGAMDGASIETIITNHRDTEIPVGVNLDNLPYIIVLIGALGGLVIFTIRRRLVK